MIELTAMYKVFCMMPFLSYMNTKTMTEAGGETNTKTKNSLLSSKYHVSTYTSSWPDLRTSLSLVPVWTQHGLPVLGGLSKTMGISV